MATLAGHRRIAGEKARARRSGLMDRPGTEPELAESELSVTHGAAGGPETTTTDTAAGPDTAAPQAADSAGSAPVADRTEVLTDDAPEQPTPDAPEEPTDVRRRRPALPTVLLALCLVAALVAAVICAFAVRHDREDVAGGDVALSAARTSAVTILSYDYRHLDSDFAAATALTTGQLRTDYQATTSKAVAQLAAQTHAVVSAKVVGGGVVSSTATTATVLLFVDQTTTSNRLSSPKTDQNRVQLTLRKVGSHWLVSGLTAL